MRITNIVTDTESKKLSNRKDYEDLVTTRKRQLEKPLNEIEGLTEKIEIEE